MDHPVEHIPLGSQPMFQRLAERNAGIGIMGTDDMKDHENSDERVRYLGQFEISADENYDRNENEDQKIFQEPRIERCWLISSPYPESKEDDEEISVVSFHDFILP